MNMALSMTLSTGGSLVGSLIGDVVGVLPGMRVAAATVYQNYSESTVRVLVQNPPSVGWPLVRTVASISIDRYPVNR